MVPAARDRRISLASPPPRAYNGGMDRLDLDIEQICRPGRREAVLDFHVVREVRVSDLALMAAGGSIEAPNIKKLSDRHHALARLIAAGTRPYEAAVVTGYQPARVSILLSDPAFEELVTFYRGKVDEVFVDTMAQISGLSQDVLAELRQRLEDAPEDFTVGQLQNLLTSTLDRSGYGPTHKQVTEVNINLAARLEEGRRRALEARREAAMRDITPPAEAAE